MAGKVKLLAFDTSSPACSVALLNTENTKHPLISQHTIQPLQQGKLILPMIEAVLKEGHLTLEELDAIAYGAGPGSFTGIRIASSVAQALSFTSQCPVIAISSLAAIAQAAYQTHQWEHVLVAVDARMQQIYWGIYEVNEAGYMALQDREEVTAAEKVLQPKKIKNWYGAGDGWEHYADSINQHLGFHPKSINIQQFPSAEAIVTLAQAKYKQQEWLVSEEALPVYLR